MKIFARQIDCL